MAVQAVSLIAVCFLATSAAHQPCGVDQCKLVPVGRDLAVRFQQLASEKGVRLVYFNLQIGNDNFHPLESNERFLAKRWVWSKTRQEPMLRLTDDEYDIYSLGLFTRQKRYMSVQLEEQPSGCLASLNASCQDNVVGEALLGNVTNFIPGNRLPQTGCVCTYHAINSGGGGWKFLCCSVQKITERNETIIRCGIALENDWFVEPFNGILQLFMYILFFYSPAIPLLIPDCFFNVQHECDKENEQEQQLRQNQVSPNDQDIEMTEIEQTSRQTTQVEGSLDTLIWTETDSQFEEQSSANREEQEVSKFEIPVDDASPITVSALLRDYIEELPHMQMNFNLKLLFLFFVVFPFFAHLKQAVILFYNLEYYQEAYRKRVKCTGSNVCTTVKPMQEVVLLHWHAAVPIACVSLFVVLVFIRPKDLLYRSMIYCPFCRNSVSLGQEIVEHVKLQRQLVYNLTFIMLTLYMYSFKTCLKKLTLRGRTGESRRRRALRSLCVLLSVLPGFLIGAALGIVCVLIFLIALFILLGLLSPFVTLLVFQVRKQREFIIALQNSGYCEHIGCRSTILITLVTGTMFAILFSYVYVTSVPFIIYIPFFTIMGLVLNYEFATPYVVFILAVAGNIHLCYSNLQSRYKEVKGMISKHWEEETTDLPWMKCNNNGTIPKELFWFVCGNDESDLEKQILPLRTEICLMLRDMALIVLFLCLTFLSIVTFEAIEDISGLVSTFFVFISGVIPTLIFKRFTKQEQFSGWNKIRIDNEIKEAVHEYVLAKMKEYDYEKPYSYEVPGRQIAWL